MIEPSSASNIKRNSCDIVGTLRALMIEHALPLWSGKGWDAATGGFVERIAINGQPDTLAPRRGCLQRGQIYCFAKAAQIGWYSDGRAIALKGLEYLLQTAKSPD